MEDARRAGCDAVAGPGVIPAVRRLIELIGMEDRLWPPRAGAGQEVTRQDVALERIRRFIYAHREREDGDVRALIADAVKAGAASRDIAEAVGVSRATIWRRYAPELRRDGEPARAPSVVH